MNIEDIKKEVHLILSDIPVDKDNLEYIGMTGEICGKLRDELVNSISKDYIPKSVIEKKIEELEEKKKPYSTLGYKTTREQSITITVLTEKIQALKELL